MSIEKWYHVKCDCCGTRDDPSDENELPIRESLKILKTMGWAHENATAITAPRDLCPTCNPANRPAPPKPVDPRQTDLLGDIQP